MVITSVKIKRPDT